MSTLGSLFVPKVQFFDNAGAPLAGGLIYFYAAGTTTPQNTYPTSALTPATENANPVELDSAGRWPIFLDQLAYKIVAKTSAGATLWTLDNVYPPGYVAAQIVAKVVQSSSSVGSQNDFALTTGASLLRLSNASDLTLTGLSAGTADQVLDIVALGAGNVFLSHQSASSLAANRLINTVTSGVTPLSGGTGKARLVYDATTARWRLLLHEQGAPIAWTPVLSFGGASVGITYSVQSGFYTISGTRMFLDFRAALTSKGSSSGAAGIAGFPLTLLAFPIGSSIDFAVAGATLTSPFLIGNSATLALVQNSGTVRGNLTDANFGNTSDIRASIVGNVS